MNEADTKPTILEVKPRVIGEQNFESEYVETKDRFYATMAAVIAWGASFAVAFGMGIAIRYGYNAIPMLDPLKEHYVLDKSEYYCDTNYCEKAPQGFYYRGSELIAVQSSN